MIYRLLGRTKLNVSLLSYGCGGARRMGIALGFSLQKQQELINRCIDLGINFFDTSADYGSEESLGKCLNQFSRDSYYLSTKWNPKTPDSKIKSPLDLEKSVEKSLIQLKTNYIDVMLFHGITMDTYHYCVENYYSTMQKLQRNGKIRFIGLSEKIREDPKHLTPLHALKTHPELWDVCMLKYGILNQYAANETLMVAQKHDVGIINMAAVRVKLPDPKILETTISEWKTNGVIPPSSLPDNEPLNWLIHDDVDSVVSAGYKFAADHPAISTVLTGTSNIKHLNQNAKALEKPKLPIKDKKQLISIFSHIPEIQ